ncbi:MAG: HVO_A0114 family putative DNA-binding protein [Candidatus Binataceae bacterium]
MSERTLNIGIRSGAERSKALREALRRVVAGDHRPQGRKLYFETVDDLRRVLTDKRLELLLAISRHHPASIYGLAGLVKRDYKNVSTDITLLGRLGLVTLQSQAGKGRAQAPTVPYDEIRVTIDLRRPRPARAA